MATVREIVNIEEMATMREMVDVQKMTSANFHLIFIRMIFDSGAVIVLMGETLGAGIRGIC